MTTISMSAHADLVSKTSTLTTADDDAHHDAQLLGRLTGLMFIVTFATAIPPVVSFYVPARSDPAFVLGYPHADRLRAQLRALDGGSVVAPAVKAVHCLGETDDGTVDELSRSFGKIGAVTATTRLESRTQWASDEAMSTSIVPADGLKAALAALGAAS